MAANMLSDDERAILAHGHQRPLDAPAEVCVGRAQTDGQSAAVEALETNGGV